MPKSFKELSEEQMRQKRQQNFTWTTPYTSAGSAHSYNQQLYDDLLNREIGKAYQYATTGSKQNENMANILLNGITQYKPGDVDSFDWQTARQSVIDNDVAIKALRGYGIFDDVGYAYNPSSIGLVSDNFLKMLSGTLPEDIANSVKLDEQDTLLYLQGLKRLPHHSFLHK